MVSCHTSFKIVITPCEVKTKCAKGISDIDIIHQQILDLDEKFTSSSVLSYDTIPTICKIINNISSGKINYFQRMKLENEIATFIKKILLNNYGIWDRLMLFSPSVISFCAINKVGYSVEFPNYDLLELAYKNGERFYSPFLLAQKKINDMNNQFDDHLEPLLTVFNKKCWKIERENKSLMIPQIIKLLCESSDSGNPDAIKLYIRYLQRDGHDDDGVRVNIGKLFELGEIGDKLNHHHLFVCSKSSLAKVYIDSAIILYKAIEQKINDGIIEREHEIIQKNQTIKIKEFNNHYVNLISIVSSCLMNYGIKKIMPILLKYKDDDIIFTYINLCIATYNKL